MSTDHTPKAARIAPARDPKLETDAKVIPWSGGGGFNRILDPKDRIGRIRREFMVAAVLSFLHDCNPSESLQSDGWDIAEEMLLEGQRRGVLP